MNQDCLGCHKQTKKLQRSEMCPVCEYSLGLRKEFPAFTELSKWLLDIESELIKI